MSYDDHEYSHHPYSSYGSSRNAVDTITGVSLITFFACVSALMLIAAIPKPAPARNAPPVGRAHPLLCNENPCLKAAGTRPRFTLAPKHIVTVGKAAAHRGVVKPPARYRSH